MRDQLKARIGIAVRHARVTAGITREDLGTSIGKSAEAVSNIERGIALPTIETLLELAAALDVSILDLIGEKDVSSQKSTKRVELELQLGSAAKKLDNNRLLAVAITQVDALARLANGRTDSSTYQILNASLKRRVCLIDLRRNPMSNRSFVNLPIRNRHGCVRAGYLRR
ncbi:MAG: helix-turn-helix domain-containing protein [Rhizobiales bacterium]|nr:helix-turn-helix domain-containing protein [Hyphomicrobiales bacterium]